MILRDTAGPVRALAFTAAGELAVADGRTVSLGPPGGPPRWAVEHVADTLAVTPDGRWVVAGGATVCAWRTDGGAVVKLSDGPGLAAVAPDGRVAVCTASVRQDPKYKHVRHNVRRLRWHDLDRGKAVNWPPADERTPDDLGFDPLGRLVFAHAGGLEVWEVAGRRCVLPRVGAPWGDGPWRFAAAGDRAACATGPFLRLYKLPKYTAAAELLTRRTRFTGMAFHPSGAWLLATDNDPAVRRYDATTGKPADTLTLGAGRLRCVAVSPDGLLGAAGGDRLAVWDV